VRYKSSEVDTDDRDDENLTTNSINRVPNNAPKFLKDLIEKTGAKPYMIPRDKLF